MSESEAKLTPRTLATRRSKIENLLVDAQMLVRTPVNDGVLLPPARRARVIAILVEILAMLVDGLVL